MKHAPNYMPYPDQCEGWVELKHHKAGNIPSDKKIIIVDCTTIEGDAYFAVCVRQEDGCSYMKTLDGRPFRITQHSNVQAYSSVFINKTDQSREGYKIGNFWLNLSHESWLKCFLEGDTYRFYALFDNTTKELCRYPQKEERSDIVWAGVARGFKQTHITMTDKGFIGG